MSEKIENCIKCGNPIKYNAHILASDKPNEIVVCPMCKTEHYICEHHYGLFLKNDEYGYHRARKHYCSETCFLYD